MKRFVDMCLAGIFAVVVIACGDKVLEPIVDAGRTLFDADGGTQLDASETGTAGSKGARDASSPNNARDASSGNHARDASSSNDGMIADATAQAPACTTCTVTSPIEVAGPLKIVTADTDVSRIHTGTLSDAAAWVELLSGPFIVTDLTPVASSPGFSVNHRITLAVAAAGKCSSDREPLVVASTGSYINSTANYAVAAAYSGIIAGARYPVAAGKVLCGQGEGNWAGFSPY